MIFILIISIPPPFALRDFSLHNARFKFPLRDGRLNDFSSVSIHHLRFGPHCHIPGVHAGAAAIWELTSFPSAVDIAIWENWNFTTTPRTIVCALYWERMFHEWEIPLSLCWNSFPDIGLNFLARPCLHCTCEWNGYRILLRTRHLHEHFSPDFWCP